MDDFAKEIKLDLAPCPFCGDEGPTLCKFVMGPDEREWIAVTCVFCNAIGPSYPEDSYILTQAQFLAAKKWNDRASGE